MTTTTPDEYCESICLYKNTIDCDIKLRCCPFWNYINLNTPKKP